MSFGHFHFGAFTLDVAKRELRRAGAVVVLPARTFECLLFLIRNRHRAVGRDELAQAVFGRENVSDAQIGQIILRARRVVEDDGHAQQVIRTVPRFGFRWVAGGEAESGSATLSPVDTVAPDLDETAIAAAADARPAGLLHAEAPARTIFPAGLLAWLAHHRRMALAALLLAVIVGGMLFWFAGSRLPMQVSAPQSPVVVLPTTVDADTNAAWVRLGLMDFIADRFRRAGVPVPPSDSTLALLRTTEDDIPRLLRVTRADRVIRSTAVRRDDRWHVSVEAIRGDGVREQGSAEHTDLLSAARSASDRLLAVLGRPQLPDGSVDLDLDERLQRAQAAMLANELDGARRILLDAPELQRATPQLRYRLMQIDFREGRFEQGLTEVNELLRHQAARAPLFRARLLNGRGAILVRLERTAAAERDFSAAIALLDADRHQAELAQALTGRGFARSVQGRFEQALDDLGRARVYALRAGDALAVARIDANFGQIEMERNRPAQALPYLLQAAVDFEAFGAINELVITRSALVAINLRLLRHDAAWAQSEKAWALRPRIRDPAQLGMLTLDRAEVLIRQGRFGDADALLESPASRQLLPGNHQRRTFLQMERAWRGGDARKTLRLAKQAQQRRMPTSNPRLQDWFRLRQLQSALIVEPSLAPPAPKLPNPGLLHYLAFALSERLAEREAAAHRAYQRALAISEASGVPEDILTAVSAYVPWLIEQGRLHEASALVGRVAPWAGRDFDAALLQLRLYRAMGHHDLAAAALVRARELSGERVVPPALVDAAAPMQVPETPENG